MRRVRLFIAASLDGFIAREDGGIDWPFSEADYCYAQFYDSVDAVLVGERPTSRPEALSRTRSAASR